MLPEKQFIISVERRGSLSVLQAKLSRLSRGMFGKCEWRSVDEIHCVYECVWMCECSRLCLPHNRPDTSTLSWDDLQGGERGIPQLWFKTEMLSRLRSHLLKWEVFSLKHVNSLKKTHKRCLLLSSHSCGALQLQRDHANFSHRGPHHRPHHPLCHRHPGVQTHPSQPNGETHITRCRIWNYWWPDSVQCGGEHSGGEWWIPCGRISPKLIRKNWTKQTVMTTSSFKQRVCAVSENLN